jgi:hypothetical protein
LNVRLRVVYHVYTRMARDKENYLRWCAANRGKMNAWHRQYMQRRAEQHPVKHTAKLRIQRLRKYGLTEEDFRRMMRRQRGRCAICQKKFAKRINACVDHCHKTGKVRGLLCRGCNVAMHIVDDDKLLSRLIRYRDACKDARRKLL